MNANLLVVDNEAQREANRLAALWWLEQPGDLPMGNEYLDGPSMVFKLRGEDDDF
jgi:hypothetical protein